ncbi:phage antirepressor KilAC domain-containing protein [Serratia fonticola]|uniref:phage antirepressor KilAC domain-containing protein n=1 Tax=Serratia fonticola TaxID=47917 RepID=UPI003AAD9F34
MNSMMVIDSVPIQQDQQGRYCLNDLHRAAGGEERHKPRNWYVTLQTQELVRILTEGGIPPLEQNQPVSVIRGGNNQGTYVCKELVYSYAMWISATFNLKVIRTFDAAQVATVPQSLPEALRLAADMAEQNAALEQKVQADAPKVAFVDNYVDASGSKSLRETAKVLNMPEKAMIDALVRDKVLFRMPGKSGNLMPHALKQREGLFSVKTGTSDFGHAYTQTRVTPRGIQWIADRYSSELRGS